MEHIITITGDMNDADDCECSFPVDLNSPVFKGWSENFESSKITFEKFFSVFGEVLKEFTKQNPHTNNWSERTYRNSEDSQTSRYKVLTSLRDNLKLDESCSPSDLMDILSNFVPGTGDYPVHTLYSITATPAQDQITFY